MCHPLQLKYWGRFFKRTKKQLIEKVTETTNEIEGEEMRHLTWVTIE